jgi:hypothetical protein
MTRRSVVELGSDRIERLDVAGMPMARRQTRRKFHVAETPNAIVKLSAARNPTIITAAVNVTRPS